MKQCVEPESTKVVIGMSGTESERKLTIKEDVLERAEALSLTSLSARNKSTQPLGTCGGLRVADYFFASEALAEDLALVLEVLESEALAALAFVDLGQSRTM